MGFKPKDRVRLKARGVKIGAMVSLKKQVEMMPQPKVRTINKLRGLQVKLNSNTNT
jgi:hypothetical protein